MIKNIVLYICFILFTGCTTVVDIAVNAIGGAMGNMIDRSVSEQFENEKEKKDECEDCKDDKR